MTTGLPLRPIDDGDLDFPSRIDESGVTELVVHGVGGAAPADMLDDPAVKQIAGDGKAGMWRGSEREIDGELRWHHEAYSWGGLTSQASTTALWLLLTPFALLNIAGWMAVGGDTRAGRPDWRIAYQQALVRILGLAATLTYVLFVAQIAMDLLAWQCPQVNNCRLQSWPSGVWPNLPVTAGQAIVIAAAVPLLVAVALHLLAVLTKGSYEDFNTRPTAGGKAGPASATDAPPLDIPRIALTHPTFWSGRAYDKQARWLHSMASILLISLLLLAVVDVDGGAATAVDRLRWIAVAALGLAVLCAGWQYLRGLLFGSRVRILGWGLATLGLLVTAGSLAWLHPIGTARTEQPGMMPAILDTFTVLLMAMYAVAVLHAVIVISARARRGPGAVPLPGVPGPLITVTIGVLLLFSVWTGVVIWVARWLSPKAIPGQDPIPQALIYPGAYKTLAQATVAGLLLVAVVVGGYALWRRCRRCPTLADEQSVWPAAGGPGLVEATARWRKRVVRRKFIADGSYAIEVALSLIAIFATGGSILYSVWFGHNWLGWTVIGRIVSALIVVGAGLSLVAYLRIRHTPARATDGTRPARGPGSWGRLAFGWIALLGAGVLGYWLVHPALGRFDDPATPTAGLDRYWPLGDGVTSTLLTAVPVGTILLVRRALKSHERRRTIATVWDIATFWPRAFHPLAPPSYAERAVPELTDRVRRLIKDHAVLLLGHSQGAMVTIATLAQLLDADGRERLSVVMYGNPVRRLYMRWFPRYVNPHLLSSLDLAGPANDSPGAADPAGNGTPPRDSDPRPRVVNFHRFTDPIGRQLLSDQQSATDDPNGWDRWLPDPPTDKHRAHDAEPRIRGHAHGGYVRQAAFDRHVRAEIHRLNGHALAAETSNGVRVPAQAATDQPDVAGLETVNGAQ